MKINIHEIREGKLNGHIVWVCDYRHNHSVTDKPIRHIKPTKVMICPNSTITKKIYYSDSHFQELDKNGNPNPKKIIGLFDNTGFRSHTGTAVQVFDNEDECNEAFCNQITEIVPQLENVVKFYENKVNELKEYANKYRKQVE